MAEPFLSEIRVVTFNFAPYGWALCNGQIMPISQNTALFSLIGTYFGGDGRSNFALPNLQGSVPIGMGQGPGLTNRNVGDFGGSTSVTLTSAQIPGHSHQVEASSVAATTHSPVAAVPARAVRDVYSTSINTNAANGAIEPVGGSQPHNNMQPYLCLNFIIALEGIYPARG